MKIYYALIFTKNWNFVLKRSKTKLLPKNRKCYKFGFQTRKTRTPQNLLSLSLSFLLLSHFLSLSLLLPFSSLLPFSLPFPPPASLGLTSGALRRGTPRRGATRRVAQSRSSPIDERQSRPDPASLGQIWPSPAQVTRISFVPARAWASSFTVTFFCWWFLRSCTSVSSRCRYLRTRAFESRFRGP